MWYINPVDYDLQGPIIKFYTPTLEKDQAILDWAINLSREGKKLDQTFIKFLPWMLEKSSKNPEVVDTLIKKAQNIYKSWDIDMFNFMDEVLRNITLSPTEKLIEVCPHCGEEVKSTVRFPMGIKHLFTAENKHRKFGSK